MLVVGVLAHNFVGRQLLWWWEKLLNRIPIVRGIYSSVKQVSDTVLSPSGQAFRKAVLVEFPRPGSWSVAFLIGTPGLEIEQRLGNSPQTVFVPTAPNPTSGYFPGTSLQRRTPCQVSAYRYQIERCRYLYQRRLALVGACQLK